MVSRRLVLAGLMAGAALPVWAEAPLTSPRPQPRPLSGAAKVKAQTPSSSLEEIVLGAGLSGTSSIVVADAGSGRLIEGMNPTLALPPASVTKSVTALYALHNLGPDYRFATRLIATGPVEGDTLRGDLVLAGGGDPHLDADGLMKLALALKALGLRRITGGFKVYGGALPYQQMIDPKQPDHVSYNPSVSGLNLNFNRVYFEWKRSGNDYATTMDARTDRMRPLVGGIGMGVVERGGPLFTYRNIQGREEWTVMRGALGNGGGRWLPVRELDAYAGGVFRTLAAEHGLRLPLPDPVQTLPDGTVLAQEVSETLASQLRAMLKYSTNLTAEVTGLTATRQRGSDAGTLAASAREMTDWTRTAFDVPGVTFVDHSGLGDDSRVSGEQMARILSRSGWTGPLPGVLKDIRLVNSKGKAAPIEGVQVLAKTGTLNFASALAGYIECPNGKRLAFAIFSADMDRRASIPKSQRERPEGGRAWARRARIMQQKLLRHWALEYGVTA